MRVIKRIILLAMFFTGLPISFAASQCQFVDDLPLLMPNPLYEGSKTIPIQLYGDTFFVMTATLHTGFGVCSEKQRFSWESRFASSSIMAGMEFMISPHGGFYVYDIYRSVLMFNFTDNAHEERYCPGRPVFDQNDRIHIIQGLSPNNYVYIVSDDTLNSLDYIDTLLNFPYFQKLIANPDQSTIGAVFFDLQNNQIIKFLSNNGLIDFSNTFVFQEDSLAFGVCDMLLNDQNELIFILGIGSFFTNYYVWTEDNRFVYLDIWPDPALEPLSFQICPGEFENEIIIIKSIFALYYQKTMFLYSSDGGNSWSRSLFEIPNAVYGSSLRTFVDTLHFAYSTDITGNPNTYYYPIPIDSITGNLTSINDEEVIPENISLFRAFPNPSNGPVTLKFTLAEPANVKLVIYAITGARVETFWLFDLQPGIYSVRWDASDIASGVYFARLEAGAESRSIKMVLLK